MIKHTPGPWEVWNGIDVFPASDFSARKHIADCDPQNAPVGNIAGAYEHPDTDMTYEEAMANARLIAAAPDMLDALKLLNKWFEITGSSVKHRWEHIPAEDRAAIVAATKAAIAKAEGASNAR